MWEYGISLGCETKYFDNERQAQWFYLALLGENKRPFAFKKLDNVFSKVEWKVGNILTCSTAPFIVTYTTNGISHKLPFYKESLAIKQYYAFLYKKIPTSIYKNIDGFDFRVHKITKFYL